MLWKLLWLLFAVAVVGYAIWSLLALLQQKRAWKAFSDKYKLNYLDDGMFSPPGFWGTMQNKKVLAYIDYVQSRNKAKAGSWNVLEVVFEGPFDDKVLVFGSPLLFRETIGDVSGLQKFVPNDIGWGDKMPLFTDAPDFFRSFLNRNNVKSLQALKTLKEGGFNFILQPENCTVSYYTKKPLESPKKINAIMKVLFQAANAWEKGQLDLSVRAKNIDDVDLKFEDEEEALSLQKGLVKDISVKAKEPEASAETVTTKGEEEAEKTVDDSIEPAEEDNAIETETNEDEKNRKE